MRLLTKPVILFAFFAVTLVAADRLPTPESLLGFKPGADYKLATYDQSIDYFKKLAATSKHIKLVEAGKTSQGRPMYFALVSCPTTWRKSIAIGKSRGGSRIRRG